MPLDLGQPLADAERAARAVAAAAWDPPPPVDYLAWAKRNVVFGHESPFPGPFDPARFPWVPGILEVLAPEHPARVVVLDGSAQIGKTVVAEIFAGGSLDLDPGPFLYVHPTTDNGERWVKQKWKVRVRSTSALSEIFAESKSREGANSLSYQERKDGRGFLQVTGANSSASLSLISVSRQVQDDLSKWEINNAGDPESQADSRSKAFEWAKILKISTPLVSPGCRISAAYKRSTQGEFQVPCPHCDAFQALTWENLRDNIDPEHPERAHFTCASCGAAIEQQHREAIVRRGHWVMRNPAAAAAGIFGFYIWTAYAATETWASLARRWLDAKGEPSREQTFLNDDAGLAYEAQGEAPPWEKLHKRAEASELRLGKIPVGALILSIGVDCQSDRVEWHLKGFGRDSRRWTIEYGVIDGHIAEEKTQAALDALLKRTWPDAFNRRRAADVLAIDAGAWKTDVHNWARRHPQARVIMVRGVPGDAAASLALVKEERTQDGKVIKYQKRYWNVGAAALKASLYRQLAKEDPAAQGFCGYPAGLSEEFFRQLTAERRQPVKNKDGYVVWRWVKIANQANEVLDTEIYAEAGAIRWGWRKMQPHHWDALEANRERPPEALQLDLEDRLLLADAPIDPARTRPTEAELDMPENGPVARAGRGSRPRGRPGRPGRGGFVKNW